MTHEELQKFRLAMAPFSDEAKALLDTIDAKDAEIEALREWKRQTAIAVDGKTWKNIEHRVERAQRSACEAAGRGEG